MSALLAMFMSSPLRIGLLTHSVNPRGGVVHTLELAHALHGLGHDVTVFAPALPGQAMFRPVAHRLELVPVEAGVPASVAAMVEARMAAFERHLAARLPAQPFDVLHAQDGIGANALATLRERGLVAGFARTVHHLDDFADARVAAWQQRGVDAAAQVMCVTRGWCDTLRTRYGIDAALVHNGVDCQRFRPQADASDARVAARFSLRGGTLEPSAPVVLAVGGVEARKNTVRIVEAFALLRRERPRAQLVIAGGVSLLDHAAYAGEFESALQHTGLSALPGGDVVITGAVPDADMPALFRAADVLALPSLCEGFGLVVLEALASGTPVVASAIAPFTEYLNLHGAEDAVLCNPHDPAAVARALGAALAPERAAALQAGPPAVCLRFGWPASAARHVALYRASAALGRPLGSTAREVQPTEA